MTKMKTALVLEGGSMRGLFTAGVLDTMMDENIQIDGILGVSAGALFGCNYFSGQKGRVLRYSTRFCKDLRNMSFLNFFLLCGILFAFLILNPGSRLCPQVIICIPLSRLLSSIPFI